MRARRTILCIVLMMGGIARASDEPTDHVAIAHDRFSQGISRYQAADYDAAIAIWEDGFRNQPAPEFLFNMARAYQHLHRAERALTLYRQYLDLLPAAPNRVEVERQVASLQHTVSHRHREPQPTSAPGEPEVALALTTTAPPPATLAPSAESSDAKSDANGNGSSQAPPETRASPPSSGSLQPLLVTTAPPPGVDEPEPVPLYRKGWFWGVLGTASALVTAAVVVGVVVGTRPPAQGNFMTVHF